MYEVPWMLAKVLRFKSTAFNAYQAIAQHNKSNPEVTARLKTLETRSYKFSITPIFACYQLKEECFIPRALIIQEEVILAALSKGCSIITSRIGSGWVSGFFVMLRDRKQGGGSEGYLMKGHNVTIKKIKKPFFLLL